MSLYGSDAALRQLQEQILNLRPGEDPVECEATSPDERVRATWRAGRLDNLSIDPRVPRDLSTVELADLVLQVVNAAVEKAESARPSLDPEAFQGLLGEVERIADEAETGFRRQTEAMDQALARDRKSVV